MAVTRNGDLAYEMEEEALFETEEEDFLEGEEEYEAEGVLGTIGNMLGGLLGEEEDEALFEDEEELEDEALFETEDELEDEGEAFSFGSIGRFLKRAAPILKQVAKVAAPVVGTAVGGPLGGLIAKGATSLLGESEYEEEYEGDGEYELHEYEETLAQPASEPKAHAALMASVASGATTDTEAEAMIGAATIGTLTARERRELRRVMAHLVRGSAILTRLLRRRRITRPAVRAVPLIVEQTAKTLTRQAATGQPITRYQAGRVMARHTQRVLSSPRLVTKAIQRNAVAARKVPVARQAIVPTARPTAPRLAALPPAKAHRVNRAYSAPHPHAVHGAHRPAARRRQALY
jgi:hypothetical protein